MTEPLGFPEPLATRGGANNYPFRCPARPSAAVPDFLHRGNDGWVPLAARVGEQWQELGSVPASQLSGLFADEILAEAVQTDSYFGLHSMYRPGHYRTKHTLSDLQPSLRNVDSVRYLTCCHVDLDGYKCGLDPHGMIAAVMRLVDEGMLPPPSLFTLSRGVWVFWRIHDQLSADAPLRAYPESVMSRWCRVQGALTRVCATIGSDAAAKHAATLTRIPGSMNTKNGRSVGYMLPADVQGQPFSYALSELETFMRPHFPSAAEAILIRPKSGNPALSQRGLRGWRGRWSRLLQALSHLRDMRGGWKVGTRSTALFYVAVALRGLRAHGEQVQIVMAQHLEWMEQPVGDKLKLSNALRIHRAVSRIRGRGASLQAVADAFDVSPDEAVLLSEGKRKPFPSASRHRALGLPELPAVSMAVAKARRLDAIRGICDKLRAGGIVPDGAAVEAHLAAQGLTVARSTVLSDMRSIGCPSRRSHRLKPPAQTECDGIQPALFAHGSPGIPAGDIPRPIDFRSVACMVGLPPSLPHCLTSASPRSSN